MKCFSAVCADGGTFPSSITDHLKIDPADFHSFVEHVAFLKNTFKTRVASSRDYLKSVLEQLEGGPGMN